MIKFPGCKINIGLTILFKRNDGYHALESVFYPLELSDILEVIPSDHFSIRTSGLPIRGDHSDNLVVKAYYQLQDAFNLPPVKIHLHKVVPMGAGLGGGSADGAAMLVLLNELFDLNISTSELEQRADQLGSDCAFFIQNQPSLIQGKGEIVKPIQLDLSDYYIYLINPGIHVPTAAAFGGINAGNRSFDLSTITDSAPKDWGEKVKNDFEDTILPLHPEIESIKKELYKNGACYASMTGTGSSVYGIFDQKPKAIFPHYFEFIKAL
jgi:4-diphosphocytidyl-2-C-methyl-D-erythritol kinase